MSGSPYTQKLAKGKISENRIHFIREDETIINTITKTNSPFLDVSTTDIIAKPKKDYLEKILSKL